MDRRSRTLSGLQAAVAVAALAIPLIAASDLGDLPPPIAVKLGGEVRYVLPSTTFERFIGAFHLHARSGDLLDVQGKVITRGVFPGRILLDGRPAPGSTRLGEGDRIVVVNRADRVEALDRQIIKLPGRHPGNPQFYLGTAPGDQVITRGRVSGKLVSSVFAPTGPSHQPPAVALTFDDGPNLIDTPRILRVLERLHVRATFFTIGYLVERYPQMVRKERRAGMIVGDHTWDHPTRPSFRDLPPKRMREEMWKAIQALRLAGAPRPRFFRPPGGSFSPQVVETARRLRMRVVLWSIDPEDWRNGITSAQIVSDVLSNVHPGSIVLLHDGGGDQSATVKALPKIIRRIRKMHLHFMAVR